MGVVYLGEARDGSQAAVKVLRPELADDPEFRTRFQREVTALTRVQGLCTVRVIEADTESAEPFLATEYADGPSLAEYVGQSGPLGPGLLRGLATGLAEALTAIHAAGVIHRDLKPSNVLLTAAGPKVIDFGIAQMMDATGVTRTGMLVGSPGYMAPEQVLGKAGQPTDVFSWGLVVAYAASGQPPFGTGPADAIIYRIVHDSPDTVAVPAEFSPLVQAALARDPGKRPAAGDLLGQLTAGSGRAPAGTEARTQTALAQSWLMPAAPAAGFTRGTARRTPLRHPLVLAGAALAVAVAVGAGAGLVANSPKPAASPAVSPTSRTQAVKAAAATSSALAAPPASRPTSTARLTGHCVTGLFDPTINEFFSMSDVTSGTGPAAGDTTAEAYQLTLDDSQSAGTAEVTSFAVAFYSGGQELTSDSENLNEPAFITPGQSLTWTEHPWGYSSSGGASIGPFAAGQMGAIDPGATCELIQYRS
jgi:hypothetical protein